MKFGTLTFKQLPFILRTLMSFGSCSTSYHYSYFGEVPEKPGKYPEFTAKDSLTGKLDDARWAYDVTSYDLDLVLNPAEESLSGKVIIRFRAVTPVKTIRFDLYENLQIKKITAGDNELNIRREGRAVYTSFTEDLVPGNRYSLEIEYQGRPQKAKNPPWAGGMVWKKDKDKNTWAGVTCETEGGSIWFPCKDHLSDEPDSVRLRMTVPAGLQVVSNGLMTGHVKSELGETYTWETHYPVNVYNITFYAGKFAVFTDSVNTREGSVMLDYFVLPENLEKAKNHFAQTRDIIKLYSELFGAYPWIKEDFKLVEAPFEGMEHQTAIAYGSGYRNSRPLGGDYIIVHEAAHEWWGNAVSVSDFRDIWLQEGFATYSEILFAERKYGIDSSLFYIKYYISPWIRNKLPVVGPPDVSYWDHKDNDVYNKGALILHTIRNITGSDIFFDILRTFYTEYATGRHPVTEDFIKVVERKTGKDWKMFFDVYLRRRELPVLSYNLVTLAGSNMPGTSPEAPIFIAKWTKVPDGFKMPVTINCGGTDYSKTMEITTTPRVFYLNDIPSSKGITLNRKLSYFSTFKDVLLFDEYLKVLETKGEKKSVIKADR